LARVRIWLRRAAVRPAAGEWGCASRTGRLTEDAASAGIIDGSKAAAPGYKGQVAGEVKMGLPDAAWANIAAMRMAMAQWWAP
jgi:hypothetical protein